MSQQTHLACEMNQGLLLVMDSQFRVDSPAHAVITGDVEMPGEEFEIGADDENPNFQRVPDQLSDENHPVDPQSQSPQFSEPRLPHPQRRITTQQFERNVRARHSTSSVPRVPSSEAALAFSASSLEPACLSNKQWKNIGVEVSYPVTADMFENPENRLACNCVIQGSCSC